MDETLILQGTIPTAGVLPLVQAVSLGRQTSAVRIFDEVSGLRGQLWVRGGKVLSIEYGEANGPDALPRFVAQRGGSFTVSTVSSDTLPEPLGDLRDMLLATNTAFADIKLLRALAPVRADATSTTGVQVTPGALRSDVPVATKSDVAPMPDSPRGSSSAPRAPRSEPPAYAEPVHPEPMRPEPMRPEPVRPESVRPEPARPEPARSEPRRIETEPPPIQPPPIQPPPVQAPVQTPPPAPPAPASPPQAPPPAQPTAASPSPRPSEGFDLRSSARSKIPIVCFASSKGGVGKTTMALNAAVALARRGLQVTLIDADPNGGVSAAVNAHTRRTTGAFDVICGAARFSDVLVTTRMNGLYVIPAGGSALSLDQIEAAQSQRAAWSILLSQAAQDADLVLVDTPGGTVGPTRTMLSCVTHVLGVLQAEPLAIRVADQLSRALSSVNPQPKLLGVVVNMFDSRNSVSAAVLQEACAMFAPGQIFDTSIPRTGVINDASLRGVVPGQADLATAPAIAWTFEQLAVEIVDRLQIERPHAVIPDTPLF